MKDPQKDQPSVLLSIVTWNHKSTINETIKSILNQTYGNYRLVIFDNNSTDDTTDIIKTYEAESNLLLIKNNENIGFCGGHNYVIKNFDFDYIILINPDIILKPDYIEQTIKAFSLDDSIGAVCGLLVQSFDENPTVDSAGMILRKSRRFELIGHGEHLKSLNIFSCYVSGLDGALPAFRRSAVDSLMIDGEFFNQLFFAHKEDWDISWRLLLFGWKIYFSSNSVAMHARFFKPNSIKLRMSIGSKIKFDAFKNQLLLLLINEDRKNFKKDFFKIIPRLLLASFYCLFFERKSLSAYKYVYVHKKRILFFRENVQKRRAISESEFREYLN